MRIANHKQFKDLIKKKRFWLCLDNIRSAYNVGAMFRTADGTGEWGILLIGISPTPDNIRVAKTALGAQNYVPWGKIDSVTYFLDFIIKNKFENSLWSLEMLSPAENIFDISYSDIPQPLFLTVGNEVLGVDAEILTFSRKHIFIPMHGFKESLNVAESASIAMYEFYRKLKYQD